MQIKYDLLLPLFEKFTLKVVVACVMLSFPKFQHPSVSLEWIKPTTSYLVHD